MPMQTDLKPLLTKTQMTGIIIKEYNRLIDHAKEELKLSPGSFQIKYHYHALINELTLIAMDLGLITKAEKERYEMEAVEDLQRV